MIHFCQLLICDTNHIFFIKPQNMPALLNADAADHMFTMPQSSLEHYPVCNTVFFSA